MRSLELDLRWQAPDECDGLPKPNGYRSHRFTSDEIENDTHRVLFAIALYSQTKLLEQNREWIRQGPFGHPRRHCSYNSP